jgi:TorA maturation chaperone TorD
MTSFLTKSIDWEPILTGQVLTLGLLSNILYSEPDLAFLQQLAEGDVFSEAPFAEDQPDTIAGLELLSNWSKTLLSDGNGSTFEEVKVDYMRLLVGTEDFKTPPWESVYFNEERIIFHEKTLKVRAWYRRFGLASEKLYNEPDDHIALEISFIAHLASLSLEALNTNDKMAFEKTLKAQHDFLEEHLLRWGPTWCTLVYENAQTDFYKGVALLLQGVLTELKEIFDLQVSR